jgi:hypothetical protein
MKPHFKMRKALFKRGLERNCKNKNVLEFDEEKNCKMFLRIFKKKIFFQASYFVFIFRNNSAGF